MVEVALKMNVKVEEIKYHLHLIYDNDWACFHYNESEVRDVLKKFFPSLTKKDFENAYNKAFSKVVKKYGETELTCIFRVPKTKTQNKKFLYLIKKAICDFFHELEKKEKEKGLIEYLNRKGLKEAYYTVIWKLDYK